MPWRRREGKTIQTPPNFAWLHLIGVGGVTVEEVMSVPDESCRMGVWSKKRRRWDAKRGGGSKRVSSYLVLC